MSTSCVCHNMDFPTYDEQVAYHKPLWEANPKQYGFLTPEDKAYLQLIAENGYVGLPPVEGGLVKKITNFGEEPKIYDKTVGRYKVRIVQDGK